VIAMRGDDRPGARKPELAGRGPRSDRSDRSDRAGRPGERGRPSDARGDRHGADRGERFAGRPERAGERGRFEERGPRLGDAAFRAQRDALEHAQQTLRKLAAQAHGEVLTQLLGAWEQRDPQQLPGAQALGKAVPAAVRTRWAQVLGSAASADAASTAKTLLRLEIAAELPSAAEHLAARRMMHLELLTQRHAASPAQTWGEDVAQVLGGPYQGDAARRLLNVLKVMLRP
jgi:hypothetical protein